MTDATNLGVFLEREVYPALFERLDRAFPEYGFRREGKRWVATTDATSSLPGSPRPDHVYCYANKPHRLLIRGGDFVHLLDLVNGGTKPSGADFPEAVRKLAVLAEVSVPERRVAQEKAERYARRRGHRSALDTVATLCQETLHSDAGDSARDYLEKHGLDAIALVELAVGVYPPVSVVEQRLQNVGHDVEAARAAGLLFAPMTGYAVFPWADANGQPVTLYGRWPAKTAPTGKARTQALPGEETKTSPLYFDRARRAVLKDLVLVEGLIDAALLQAQGEAGVIACLGAQFSDSQLETLARYGVNSVTMCLDPDGAGERGTLGCIDGLSRKGIKPFVAPRLPDGMDPDEFVLARGLDAWRAHVGHAEHGFCYKARAIVRAHTGEGWADRSIAACLDEAIAFAASVKGPERLTDLSEFFWPEIRGATGADEYIINSRLETAREKAGSASPSIAVRASEGSPSPRG